MPTDGNSDASDVPVTGPRPFFAESLAPGLVMADTYEITRLIGRGGMGAVWEAKHLRLPGRLVAIKVLLGGAGSEEVLARFRREAEIASRLGHPHIVDVFDFNTLPDGTPYQVLERLVGESLGERLRRGPMPLAETVALVRQVGSALAAAHREGVVHRDLKPENIFLTPPVGEGQLYPRVKILDFGISKIRGAHSFKTQESVVMGTPQYMSPEQASGRNQEVDHRTDVFALGAIVYEMLSGQPAFQGENPLAVMVQVIQVEPTPLAALVKDVPEPVLAAVASALTKPWQARCPDVATFVNALSGRPLDAPTLEPAAAGAPPSAPVDAWAVTAAPKAAPGPAAAAHPPSSSPTPTSSSLRAEGRSGRIVLLGTALAVAVSAGAFFGFQALSRAPVPNPIPAPAPPEGAEPTPPALAGPEAAAQAAPVATPEPPAEPPSPRRGDKAPRRPREALPEAVVTRLDEAEALLSAGQTREAIRVAKQTLYERKSSRAFALIARAACREGDLTNARAYLQNVARADRGLVVAACARAGMDLGGP